MAQSTADRFDIQNNDGPWYPVPVDASTHIYSGTLVAIGVGTSGAGTGSLLTPLADTVGLRFFGISRQNVNNTGTTGGEVTCQVEPIPVIKRILVNATTPLQSWVGKLLFAIDDHTVGLAGSTTNTVVVGRCLAVWKTGASGSVIVDTEDRGANGTAA